MRGGCSHWRYRLLSRRCLHIRDGLLHCLSKALKRRRLSGEVEFRAQFVGEVSSIRGFPTGEMWEAHTRIGIGVSLRCVTL
jgi:hypothetical protein